ncbi:hypothetical protein HK097_000260 [Rhizophlyctis rosea]|uniref:D-isomer specific 2-hydroxyacid dehydrogenase NAD-binding domain-containing protein n=1 Tax=Rhizophlyctis rosea TaxID=64517 RepID=A0AAD5S8T9_9FUNG|nr:hypothetical protein HK097_000260 [Rhizophlyctis rosea]
MAIEPITGPIVVITSFPFIQNVWIPLFQKNFDRPVQQQDETARGRVDDGIGWALFATLQVPLLLMEVVGEGAYNLYPNLRLIISVAAGVEKLLNEPSLPKHVPIVRLEDDAKCQSMTETVLAHVLNLHKGTYEYIRNQREEQWLPRTDLPHRAQERTVAVLGYGDLGKPAAEALAAFGFNVVVWRRTSVQGASDDQRIKFFTGDEGFTQLLNRTSILVNLLPLTPTTHGILNKANLSQLPHGASIINLARGGHVNDDDLLTLLDNGHIDTAVLDVFNTEPLPEGHRYWKHPRVIATPHVAAYSDPRNAGKQVMRVLEKFAKGEDYGRIVDLAAGY